MIWYLKSSIDAGSSNHQPAKRRSSKAGPVLDGILNLSGRSTRQGLLEDGRGDRSIAYSPPCCNT